MEMRRWSRQKQRSLIGREGGGGRWRRRGERIGVEEIGTSEGAAEGAGGAVVSDCGLLGGVEGSEPVTLFGGRVPDLGGVSAPWPPSDSEETVGRRFRRLLLLLSPGF